MDIFMCNFRLDSELGHHHLAYPIPGPTDQLFQAATHNQQPDSSVPSPTH